ncbi:MAG TPA: DNA polymerase/3'-5' exonuclease PolX [Gemmatimonadaceae bacterium]|nr:DNA polymerase/3'-5' exonuclease PolX [Gemmatimonadaceae bacterium]
MDSRTAAHVLSGIADHLDLRGENPFKVRAYRTAARSVLAAGTDDLRPLLESGELAALRGLGPATIAVIRDLVEQGESRYLEELRGETPEGLIELSRVPGLSQQRIHQLHQELGISSVEELETAALEGRLTKVKGLGPKTAQKILKNIEFMRAARPLRLYVHAIGEADALLAAVRSHPDVARAELAGSLRRRVEVAGDVDVVAACTASPATVAQSFARLPGLRASEGEGASVRLQFMDGLPLDLHCVPTDRFGVALARATGSAAHVRRLQAALAARGLRLEGDTLLDARGRALPTPDETTVYAAAGLAMIAPELREDGGEIEAAAQGTLPGLIRPQDIRGVLHCHSTWSDGKNSIAEMARAAQALGWSYLGISDHSQAAFYASGVSREDMLAQHDEIDKVNATLTGFRVLKGVEADILADGRLDYDEALLDRFDYVIASIHSRFRMDGDAMTQRVLRAMDDPHMTILAHPTGRLLLSREPYALDLDAVFEKAAATGVAVEINADPHRLDLDWRYLRRAQELGVTFEIGPDAHSRRSLEWTELGVAMARKGWLGAADVLNTRSVDDVLAFARRRRA